MGKSTAEQAAITRQKILDTSLSILMSRGFEHVTLGNIARDIPMSRSGINTHFPKKEDIIKEIAPIVGKYIQDALCFDSCEEFFASWTKAIDEDDRFVSSAKALGPVIPTHIGFENMVKMIKCDDKDKVKATIYEALGYALVNVSKKEYEK